MLRQAEGHGQGGVQQAEQATGKCRHQQPGPEIGTVIDSQPADHCAEGHDAFYAEIEHARPFAQQRPQSAENQRRGNPQHGCPETDGGEYVGEHVHRRILYWAKNSATSMVSSDRATVTSAI